MTDTTHDPAVDPRDRLERRVGPQVRRLREQQGWTQVQLASALAAGGVNLRQPTVARLESGARPITLTEAAVLARVLGVRPADLWDRPEAPSEPVDVAATIRRLEQADVRLKQLEAAEESSLAERALLSREIAGAQVAISTTRRHISEMEELLASTQEGARVLLERRERLVASWSDDDGQTEERGVRP